MTTLLFVHGTGVRKVAYDETLTEIRKQVVDWPGVQVEGCFWGEDHGVKLHARGASVPTYEATRAISENVAIDPELARWNFLYRDSLGELRLLAIAAGPAPLVPVGGESGQDLLDDVDAFDRPERVTPALHEHLVASGLRDVYDDARTWVIEQDACRDALRQASEPFSEYRYAVARAIVAEAIACRRALGCDPDVRLDIPLRDALVDEIVAALGHGDRNLVGRLGYHAWKLAAAVGGPVVSRLGTFGASFHRGRLTDAAALQIGDILLYQARGETIRAAIAAAIRAVAPPVVVLAHSLGGIASVDLLVLDEGIRRGVAGLVTVGSQAPFLYELGALVSLPFGRDLPPAFPPWLNLYDLNDYLSYVGRSPGLFGEQIDDRQVFSGRPFPAAHSAYWKEPEVWELIRRCIP
jgi:hypothetical protein